MVKALVPDLAIPTPENAEEKRFVFALAAPKNVNEENRTMEITINTRSIDREWDVVEPTGLDFSDYMNNPVVLWVHNRSEEPIGRALSVVVTVDKITAIVQFDESEKGLNLFRMYSDRWISGWSISFLPKPGGVKMIDIPVGNDEQGQPVTRRGYHVTEALVIEFSAVPIPANADCLTKNLSEMACKGLQSDLTQFTTDGQSLHGLEYTDLKMPEADVKKQYTLLDDRTVGMVRDDGWLEYLKAPTGDPVKTPDGYTVRDSAFSKSIAEAVAAGKILTERVKVKSAGEAGTEIAFEPIQINDDKEIVEARVLGIIVKVFGELTPDKPKEEEPVDSESTTPPEGDDGREKDKDNAGEKEGEPKDDDDTEKSFDLHSVEKDLAEAEMELEVLSCNWLTDK